MGVDAAGGEDIPVSTCQLQRSLRSGEVDPHIEYPDTLLGEDGDQLFPVPLELREIQMCMGIE